MCRAHATPRTGCARCARGEQWEERRAWVDRRLRAVLARDRARADREDAQIARYLAALAEVNRGWPATKRRRA